MNDIVVDSNELDEIDLYDTADNKVVTKEDNSKSDEPSFTLPDKFKDKGIEEVVQSYLELEREYGRKNNELGEVRSLADRLMAQELELKKESTNKVDEVDKDITFDDLVSSPKDAVNKVVDEKVSTVNDKLNTLTRQLEMREFASKHPDFQEIGSDENFLKWVQETPYRVNQFKNANDNYDFAAADDLLSTWKERKSWQEQSAQASEEQRIEEDLKKAGAESSSTQDASKRIFKRAQVMRLRLEQPSKYAAMQEEIDQAYLEGRVR